MCSLTARQTLRQKATLTYHRSHAGQTTLIVERCCAAAGHLPGVGPVPVHIAHIAHSSMFTRHSRSPSWQSFVYQSTPKSPRARIGFLIPFWVVLCLLLTVVWFPDIIERIHCLLGLRQHCDTTVPIAQAVMYNRYAIRRSCTPSREGGRVVVVTGSAGFIGFTASLALKGRGDGIVGIDNFNDYYPVSLKHARASELASAGIHTVHGDINNFQLLQQVFEVRQCRCDGFPGCLTFARAARSSSFRRGCIQPVGHLHAASQEFSMDGDTGPTAFYHATMIQTSSGRLLT